MPNGFQDLLGALGQAAMYAQRMAATAALRRWRDMTDEVDGKRVPKTEVYRIAGRDVEVSDLSMSHPSVIPLDELKVKFSVDMDFSSVLSQEAGEEGVLVPEIKVTPKTGLFSRNSQVEVEATFRMVDPPEAIEVLRDALANSVKEQVYGGGESESS